VREIQLDPSVGLEVPTADRDMGDTLGANEAIRRAFARLSPEQRTYLVLHYVEHRAITEIAAIVDAPEGTVKWRLSEARRALENRLARENR
jgi:RNA polymerase sigma-70 factor (ECF subfamily)